MKTFAPALEAADDLEPEDHEPRIAALEKRLTERRREELIEAVAAARVGFKAGHCRPATSRQILKRILASAE